ncbi:MAG: MBL fold metallo-hydrolase [Gammaproteobacteria bacterium]|nr:MBL fold metallo-hydrolase [Gammaproteobacteria bacterium]MDP2142199.1 MBL fold metallo-hydrolase [Gammaproteobacteria bacterium]MDP2348287.1 MBL fold metallo-hydrolase [Gammaproteobacteria bacterium]
MHQPHRSFRKSASKRSGALLLAGMSLFGATLISTAQAQTDYSTVEIIPHEVRGTVHYLQGAGGNIGLSIGEDGIIMIDDQFAPLTDKILAAIRGLSDGEIRFLINTHMHGDHTGGNENLGRLGIVILARDEVRVRMATTQPKIALPVLTYSEDITLHLNGEEVISISVPPAHTDGDSYIYFTESDVLHMGDVFRTTGYPFIDLANGGSLHGTISALGLAIGMSGPNTIIIPGHGDVSTREDVMAFRDMILDVVDRVKPLVEGGMTFEQVTAAAPTARYDAQWGDPARFLQSVYTELGRE